MNIETIRFYERVGLMPVPPRGPGGHRLYDEKLLKRLTFIRRGRELGFTLEELRGLLRLVDGGDYSCGEVKALTLDHLDEIQRKVADLRNMARVLKEMAANVRVVRCRTARSSTRCFESAHNRVTNRGVGRGNVTNFVTPLRWLIEWSNELAESPLAWRHRELV